MLYLSSSQHLMAPGSSSWAQGDILQEQTRWAASSSSTELWRNPPQCGSSPSATGIREPQAPGGVDKA